MIPLFIILVIALMAIVGSVTQVTTIGVRNIGKSVEQQKALSIAEAGLNKAVWYLTTPPEEGGMGKDWRTEGVTEEFSGGSFIISIKDDPYDPDLFIISSKGSYQYTSQHLEVVAGEIFAGRFVDYALHSDQAIGIDEAADISGDIYADGDVTVESGAQVTDGTVSVTEGHAVTGEGSYVEGATALEDPPVIDYDFYAEKIAVAEAGGPNVLEGDRVCTYFNLNGQSVYVNGNVTIEGEIVGNGEIVSSASVDIRDEASFSGRVRIIAEDKMRVFAGADFDKAAMLYAENLIYIRPNFQNASKIALLTPKVLNIQNNAKMIGIFFGGNIKIGENSLLVGNVIGGAAGGMLEVGPGVKLRYRDFTGKVPAGFKTTVKILKWLKRG